jgi:hypothetical protein
MFVVVWWHGIVMFALRGPKIKGVWILLEPFKAQWLLYVPLGLIFKKSLAFFAQGSFTFLYGSQNRQRLYPCTKLSD